MFVVKKRLSNGKNRTHAGVRDERGVREELRTEPADIASLTVGDRRVVARVDIECDENADGFGAAIELLDELLQEYKQRKQDGNFVP